MKKCTGCSIEKHESDFHCSSKAKDGLQRQCRACRNTKASIYAREHRQQYYENRKRWMAENVERERENKRLRRLRNKGTDKEEKRKVYSSQERKAMLDRRKQNLTWLAKRRSIKAEFERNKRKNLLKRLESQIRSRTAVAIKGMSKLGKYEQYIGCSTEDLKQHLEMLFKSGMTWNNWGRGGWHIDHILPVSSFDLADPVQFFKAFHFSNLQPLWETDNLSKGAKIILDLADKIEKQEMV